LSRAEAKDRADRKLVKESQDGLIRALKVQALDK